MNVLTCLLPCRWQVHMALYSFANGHSSNASKLLCRARYIILSCCGENHPQISLIDVRRHSSRSLAMSTVGDLYRAISV